MTLFNISTKHNVPFKNLFRLCLVPKKIEEKKMERKSINKENLKKKRLKK